MLEQTVSLRPRPTWRFVATSLTGTSHLAAGIPCQDAWRCRALPTGEIIVAVADGAGSASLAAEGAEAAVGAAIDSLAAHIAIRYISADDAPALMRRVFQDCQAAVIDRAAQLQVEPDELYTTLCCVAVTDNLTAVGQIGDGIAILDSGDRVSVTAISPQRGEFANETYFLTMQSSLTFLEVRVLPEMVHALTLTTDGLLTLVGQGPHFAPNEETLSHLFDFLAASSDLQSAQQDLADWLRATVQPRVRDDLTLLLAMRS